MLFCNNLSYFGVLLDWIDKAAPQMIEDIRLGKMSVTLSDNMYRVLHRQQETSYRDTVVSNHRLQPLHHFPDVYSFGKQSHLLL